ncbi:hypothetical protein GCM10009836_69030 [Pseudonocardia ailaonensis]|uniref:4Fe-4S Wbl-type domain-containing protein n=1 Tax=Pseudonocardia ailaonensis TaxID=367279 RepID=A0ABN2NNN4_9PSEU
MKTPPIVPLNEALSALLADPDLRGGLCRAEPTDYDPAEAREPEAAVQVRHARAANRCRRCPVLARCRAALDQDLGRSLTGFVLGGRRIVTTKGTR